ncbi:hypothetical protein T4B_14077 [Trichinella pseudospiralis]|nr:hypothetical protein T4B_14077 [Trichinella pseudospiralis]
MMIYGKLWSLLCHYLLDEFFMKAVLHGLTVLSTFYTANVTVEVGTKFCSPLIQWQVQVAATGIAKG